MSARPQSLILWSAVLALVLSSTPLYAHGGRPIPRKLYVDPAGQLMAVVSSDLGLHVTEDGGETWYWICEDIIGFDVRDFALVGEATGDVAGRVWLAGGTGITQDEEPVFVPGLYSSTDGGCNWSVVDGGFGGQWASGISVHPGLPNHVVVTTDHTSMPNGIARSEDGGASWTWVVADQETKLGTLYRAESDPEVLYASATTHLLRSDDGGRTWVVWGAELVEEIIDELAVHAIDPEEPSTVYFSLLTGQGMVLYVTEDAGATYREILTPSTWEFSAATVLKTDDAGGRMIVAGTLFGDGFRSTDGGMTWELYLADVESIDCLAPDPSDLGSVWVCSNPFVQILTPGEDVKAIGRSRDGAETVEKFFTYADTDDYRQCAGDSQVETVCVALLNLSDAGSGDAADAADVGVEMDLTASPDDAGMDAGMDLSSGAVAPPTGDSCACALGAPSRGLDMWWRWLGVWRRG